MECLERWNLILTKYVSLKNYAVPWKLSFPYYLEDQMHVSISITFLEFET